MRPGFFIMALVGLAFLLPWRDLGHAAEHNAAFSKEEIEQLVAPIALYPDPLLTQVLMASTYPLEVVSAARFVAAHPHLKDKALEESLVKQPWDESVKSLVTVPQVLDMLNEKLDMTQKLGDAFLAQKKEVLNAVQDLRARAQEAGNLQSSKEQVVHVKREAANSYITIEAADPEVIYVPSYDPNSIYGSWPYADYPPNEYYPPGYVAGTAGFYYGAGLATGYALWGKCNWRDGTVSINVGRFNNFNRTNIADGTWRHHVEHRKGVQYRDRATQQRFGKGQLEGAEAREAFRGRAEQGQEKFRRSPGDRRDHMQRPTKLRSQGRDRGQKQGPSDQQSSRVIQPRRGGGSEGSGVFDGIDRGRQTSNYSQRGKFSRPSSISRGGRQGAGNRGAGGRGGRGGRGGGGGRRR